MDAGSVSAPAPIRKSRGSWKLAPPHDRLTQGLVVSGFGALETGRALFLEFGWDGDLGAGGGAWLRALNAVAPVSDADGRDERAAALAFSYSGLRKMGLDAAALASLARPFREGMLQEDRLRRLGDRRDGEWLKTVIDGGPKWSANNPAREATPEDLRIAAFEVPDDAPPEERVTTPVTVHALLLLYTADEAGAEAWCAEVSEALKPLGVTVAHRLPLVLDVKHEDRGISREHFGFADGLSQPIPFGDAVVHGDGSRVEQDECHGVPLGEILIGHENGHRETAPGPVASRKDKAVAAGLPPHAQAEGFFDLGLDGSYMVVRELKQDVAAFWKSMRANAEHIRTRDPEHSAHVTADWIAERVVGRGRDGHLLCPGGYLPRGEDGLPDSGFMFFDRDQHGLGCPAGSHVRRANPRDSLAPDAGQKQTLLDAANNHRILRRGRKYGPAIDPARIASGEDDGVDRGLLFICLNTDIARQFEFVQQTWLLNQNFATLYDEVDPLIGPAGRMTIREAPLRRIVNVETFVQLVGGDYFFLPSMPALAYLQSL